MIRGNIRDAKREEIEAELRAAQDPAQAYFMMLRDDLRRRDEIVLTRQVAADKLRQWRRNHIAIIAEIKEANRIAKWALGFVCLAGVLGAITGWALDHHSCKNNQPPKLPPELKANTGVSTTAQGVAFGGSLTKKPSETNQSQTGQQPPTLPPKTATNSQPTAVHASQAKSTN